jgi:hypothetical protein
VRRLEEISDETSARVAASVSRVAASVSRVAIALDCALVFVLRATNTVLADESQTPREIIAHLWNILDEPELNRALGIPQNSHMKIGRKKPPAR